MSDEAQSRANAAYWNELCGTNIAQALGIDDRTPSSLSKFDEWFFDFYPYLIPFLEKSLSNASRILEVGLGYGSVASHLASTGFEYTGLDIALGPVGMCNQRLKEAGLPETAKLGDALAAPFEDNYFDAVVAIGSLHHTGNFDLAISEMCRITKPQGVVCGMVYSTFSARNLIRRPLHTFKQLIIHQYSPVREKADTKLRWMSDHNQNGEAAPATEYFSRKALRVILSQYGEVEIHCHNLDSFPLPFNMGLGLRKLLLKTKIASWLGLDLYFRIHLK